MTIFALLYKTFHSYTRHVILIGLVGLFGSVVTAIGAGVIIPLLSLLLGQSAGKESQWIEQWVRWFFSFLPFPYTVPSLLGLIAALFLCKGAALYLFSYIRLSIMYDYRTKQMVRLFEKILHARWPFLIQQQTGYVQNILVQDVDKSANLLGSLSHMLLSIVSAAVFLVFAFTISPRITLITLGAGAVLLLISKPVLARIKSVRTAYSLESKRLFQFLVEHLGGLKSIKSAAVEEAVYRTGESHFQKWRDLELKGNLLRSLNKQSVEPASVILIASIFAFSYQFPDFNFQSFFAAMYLVQQTFRHLELIQGALQDVNESIPHMEHIVKFEGSLEKEREQSDGGKPFSFSRLFSLTRVSFSHTADAPLLTDLAVAVQKGEMIGLVGPSGVGKTTVADLMLRLFDPARGEITLDGVGANQFSLTDWRRRVGYVAQDIFLLDDTIENNIKFYRSDITDAAMRTAAQEAYIYDFIKSLPAGFSTIVGERGVMLSGGQRQRVVLARILAGGPEFLILDEATSALDNESEVAIQKAIQELRGKVTIFVIAHRLSTLMDVDRVLVLNQGKIVEEGRPQEFLSNPQSYFYKMYHLREHS